MTSDAGRAGRRTRAVVVGGGAAGVFGALRAAELGADVTVLEAGAEPLSKVLISGGGRCNVTTSIADPRKLVENYPRGGKELLGAFTRFGPRDTVAWFESRGVTLKTEPDGRIFPTTDDARTIHDALLAACDERGVEVRTRERPHAVAREGDRWRVTLRSAGEIDCDRVLLASGSSPTGLAVAAALGHEIATPVPALFSFMVRDARIEGLAGVAVPHVKATLTVGDARPVTKEGALLVTHQGFSAHSVLRLSSWCARELADAGYRARLMVDLAPDASEDDLRRAADATRAAHARGTIGSNAFTDAVPRRLWERLVAAAGVHPMTTWSEVPKKGLNALVGELKRGAYDVVGKGEFREEIVTCGGVLRREVDWRTMESRRAPGIHLAGEILDVDGLTGGFNFQNAWTTGWIAGSAIGSSP